MEQIRLLRNGEEYVIANDLGKWGILQRMPEKYYPFLGRSERSLEWIYPPNLSSKRKAMLKLNEIVAPTDEVRDEKETE